MTLCPVNTEKYSAAEKVGTELLDVIGVTYEDLLSGDYNDSGETYSCIIWIKDVELEEAVEAGIDAAELTRENAVSIEYSDYYTSYENNGVTYIDVALDETENDEYVQTYIEAERYAAEELYNTSNNEFVMQNFMSRDMSVKYVSKYSPCIFADLSVGKISELCYNDEVIYIGFWDEPESLCDLSSSTNLPISTEVLESNLEAVDYYDAKKYI